MVFEIPCNNEIPVFQSKAHTQTPHPPLNFTIYHSTFYHFNTYLHYFIRLSSIVLVNRTGPPTFKTKYKQCCNKYLGMLTQRLL